MARQQKYVRSFDLFDTLVGRLHFHPESIFHIVQEKFSFPGFAFYRIAAERLSNRSLPDIYQKFQQLTDVTDAQACALMQCEFDTELNEIFPITENIEQVQDGDLIISDTYYTTMQVRRILQKIGLKKRVKIYARTHGKSSGKIWDFLKKRAQISLHIGDSAHSDVLMPQSRNIPALLDTKSQLSWMEQQIAHYGHHDLAYLMRAVRLQNPYPTSTPEFFLWNEQCQLNLPLLILASVYLNDFCKTHQKKRILFTLRDSCLWIQIFRALYPEYQAIPFTTSRYTYHFPTPSFIAYVRGIYTDDSIIVDIRGTGHTCMNFFASYLQTSPIYLAVFNCDEDNHAVVRVTGESVHCEAIEKINYDTIGTLYDIHGNKAIRAPLEYNIKFITPSHACIQQCLKLLPYFSHWKYEKQLIKFILKQMELGLVLDKYVSHAYHHCQVIDSGHHPKCVHLLRNGYLLVSDIPDLLSDKLDPFQNNDQKSLH